MRKGEFDLEDLSDQLKQMEKLGGMSSMLGMLPGIGKIKKQIDAANLDDRILKRQRAIISSMTPKERRNPKVLDGKRKRRIAAGSGTKPEDINRLLKMHRQMADMMKMMGKRGGMMQRMMGRAAAVERPSAAEMEKMQAELARLDPKALESLPKELKDTAAEGPARRTRVSAAADRCRGCRACRRRAAVAAACPACRGRRSEARGQIRDWGSASVPSPLIPETDPRNLKPDHKKGTEDMSVKIRLSRGGTKKRPYYYIVVANSASPRDGRYIEQIGTHNPLLAKDNADRVKLDVERAKHWLSRRRAANRPRGALPRRGRPRQARGEQQPDEGQAQEEAPRARGRPGRSRGQESRRRRGQAGGLGRYDCHPAGGECK